MARLPLNEYGNIDIQRGVPSGFSHVPGARIASACKALGIECAPALVRFSRVGGRYRPETDGVVVASVDADRLREYLASREVKKQKAAPARQAKAAKRELERERLAASLGVLSDSRAFAAFVRGDIDADEARRIGRITSARHEQTNYDDLLRMGYSKQEARAMKEPKLDRFPTPPLSVSQGASSARYALADQGNVLDLTRLSNAENDLALAMRMVAGITTQNADDLCDQVLSKIDEADFEIQKSCRVVFQGRNPYDVKRLAEKTQAENRCLSVMDLSNKLTDDANRACGLRRRRG